MGSQSGRRFGTRRQGAKKKSKVGNMLTKMKGEHLIINKTVGNVSYWSLLDMDK